MVSAEDQAGEMPLCKGENVCGVRGIRGNRTLRWLLGSVRPIFLVKDGCFPVFLVLALATFLFRQ